MIRSRKLVFGVLGVLVAGFLGLQLVPVERSNPPVEMEIEAPAEVLAVLRPSCYDCHSHHTDWPWHTRIAPVSWLVAHDVEEGREHLNFSTWNRYDARRRADLIEEVWEEVEEGEMPLWYYLPAHPDARLTNDDRAILSRWASVAGRRPRH